MTMTGRVGDDGAHERRRVVISSPEELIASVPAMLGFPPGPGSVVVLCGETADGAPGPVVRMDADGLLVDRPEFDDDEAPAVVDEGVARGLAHFCSREGIADVHLVVVHEECPDSGVATQRAEDAADAFVHWLGIGETRVKAAYGVGGFAAGAAWVDLFGMVCGVQLDPDSTEIAAVYAFDGRIRAGSREEIESMYLQRDSDACDVDQHGGDPVRLGGRDAVAAAVARHDEAVRRMEAGEEVADDGLADIGSTLLDFSARDEVYGRLARRGLADDDGRRSLWWALARRRPGRERSVALTLLGAGAYFGGSGVHARSAFTAALIADPGNTLARLILEGLDNGLAPERLRQVAAA